MSASIMLSVIFILFSTAFAQITVHYHVQYNGDGVHCSGTDLPLTTVSLPAYSTAYSVMKAGVSKSSSHKFEVEYSSVYSGCIVSMLDSTPNKDPCSWTLYISAPGNLEKKVNVAIDKYNVADNYTVILRYERTVSMSSIKYDIEYSDTSCSTSSSIPAVFIVAPTGSNILQIMDEAACLYGNRYHFSVAQDDNHQSNSIIKIDGNKRNAVCMWVAYVSTTNDSMIQLPGSLSEYHINTANFKVTLKFLKKDLPITTEPTVTTSSVPLIVTTTSQSQDASSLSLPVMPVLKGPFGGRGGQVFNDLIQLDPSSVLRRGIRIKKIDIRAGDYVDSIKATYGFKNNDSARTLDQHGGYGGTLYQIILYDDEVIVKMEGSIGRNLVCHLTLTSRRMDGSERRHGPYGQTGETAFSIEGIIVAFSGRSGLGLDSLGAYTFALPALKSEKIGSTRGFEWDDMLELNYKPFDIHSITVNYGNLVNSIQVIYRLLDGSLFRNYKRGESNGSQSETILFENGDRLTKIKGRTNGAYISRIKFSSLNKNGSKKVYGPFGKSGNSSFSFKGSILGFRGRSGSHLNQLGVYYKSSRSAHFQINDLFGGRGGSPWDDNIGAFHPRVTGIKRINIRSGNQVDNIQVVYSQEDGSEIQGERHGGYGGNPSTVVLDNDELIIELKGKTNGVLIDQITFITMNSAGRKRSYGPFGKTGKTPFSVKGHVVGFIGRSGSLIDGLGVYLSMY